MIYRIRAHHGMCFSFFQGKGYSGEFTENMRNMKEKLSENPEVVLLRETDDVCACCPNNREGECVSAGQVSDYDGQVLFWCGLRAGARLRWEAFERLVEERILKPGRREEICGDCEWNELCSSCYNQYHQVTESER